MRDLVFKTATIDDFDGLWQLVSESIAGQETRMTYASLREDLFGQRELETSADLNEFQEPSIELDLGQAQATVPFCQALLAQAGRELVGYLMFHHFYSPWKGRKACINYVYVKPEHRNVGKLLHDSGEP